MPATQILEETEKERSDLIVIGERESFAFIFHAITSRLQIPRDKEKGGYDDRCVEPNTGGGGA